MAGADQQVGTRNAGNRCGRYRVDEQGRQRGCYSRRCGSPECQRQLRRRDSAIRREAFLRLPPTYVIVLGFGDKKGTHDREMADYLKKFSQRLRDARKRLGPLESELILEFSHGRPHVHGTLRTEAGFREVEAAVKAAWVRSVGGRPTTAYVRPVENAAGWATYIAKGACDQPVKAAVPRGWSGARCKFQRRSANFYGGATRRELLKAANARACQERQERLAREQAERAESPTPEPTAQAIGLEKECTTGGPNADPAPPSACEQGGVAGRAAGADGRHAGAAAHPVSGTPVDCPCPCVPAAPGYRDTG